MSEPVFIDDGMERPFSISREPGVHGSLNGLRRMLVDREVSAYRSKCERYEDKGQQAASEALRNKLIAKQVTDWDVPGPEEGEAREISEAVVARLHPVLLSKLEAVVLGLVNDGAEEGAGGNDDALLEGVAKNS